jgi:hypothetical protein
VGTVFKKTFTTPLLAGAKLFTREGQQSLRLGIADKLAAFFGLHLVNERKGNVHS